jgi:biopolymer transport protein ExbD
MYPEFRMKIKRERSTKTGIDMTPMIDVVFQLLTFFMITSTVIKTSAINVDLPSASTSDAAPIRVAVVTLYQDGTVKLNDKNIDFNNLGIEIATLKTNSTDIVVTIQGDKNVPYDKIIQTMDIARFAGVKKMSLATLLKENKP